MRYIPELSYWFNKYWTDNSDIKIQHVNTDITSENMGEGGSFIELLFNETFSNSYYGYTFKRINISQLSPKYIDRISVKDPTMEIYISDSTSDLNIFSLTENDLYEMDELFKYRHGIPPTFEKTYEELDTNLSKLIFIYLEVKIRMEKGHIDNISDISTNNILEDMFKLYVINELHKFIKNLNFIIDSNTVELAPARIRYPISDFNDVKIDPPLPYDIEQVAAYLNGEELINGVDYRVTLSDSTNDVLNWISHCNKLYENNNFLIVDYLYEIDGSYMLGQTCDTTDTSSGDMTIIGISPGPGAKVL